MTVIAYGRILTHDPDNHTQAQALERHGYDSLFAETRTTPSRDKSWRPQLAKAIRSLNPGDTLLVWKLDRVCRSILHLGQIAEACQHKRAHLKSICEPAIDTTRNPHAYATIAQIVQCERAIIHQRTAAGLDMARALGRKGGRPKGFRLKRPLTPREEGGELLTARPVRENLSGIEWAERRSERE